MWVALSLVPMVWGMKVKVLLAQSCLTLCDPMDCSPIGSSVHGIFQARPFPSPGDLPNPGIEPGSPALQTDSSLSEPLGVYEFW